MTLREIETRLHGSPFFDYEIPLQMQFGLPYLYEKNGSLFLQYFLHRQRYESGMLYLYPKRYQLELLYPFRRIVLFEDCRRHTLDDAEIPVCMVNKNRLIAEGKIVLDELYVKADQVIDFWMVDRTLFEKSFFDFGKIRMEIIKEFGLDSLYGG